LQRFSQKVEYMS